MTKPNNVWPLDQWVALNRILKAYKIAGILLGLLLGLLCMALVALVFYLATSPPVVVVLKENSQQGFYYGERKRVPITEPALRDFLKEFVQLRYTWKERDPELILKNIAPFITEGLLRKISHSLKATEGKGTPPGSIEQVAVNIQPTVTEEKAQAIFDRIIRVKGVPVLAPMELEFDLIKGKATRWNPQGLYINGITQRETQ